MTVEPPEVQNWWARKLAAVNVEPTFDSFKQSFIVDGAEKDNQFCCLYVVADDDNRTESLIVVAESILQRGYFTGTNHQMALMTFMGENNFVSSSKFCHILGFWLDKQTRKVRSCANYFAQGTRGATDEMEARLNNLVFPVVEEYFHSTTTFCCGVTRKGQNCKRLIKNGRNCHWHTH